MVHLEAYLTQKCRRDSYEALCIMLNKLWTKFVVEWTGIETSTCTVGSGLFDQVKDSELYKLTKEVCRQALICGRAIAQEAWRFHDAGDLVSMKGNHMRVVAIRFLSSIPRLSWTADEYTTTLYDCIVDQYGMTVFLEKVETSKDKQEACRQALIRGRAIVQEAWRFHDARDLVSMKCNHTRVVAIRFLSSIPRLSWTEDEYAKTLYDYVVDRFGMTLFWRK